MIAGEQVYLPDLQSGSDSITLTGQEYHHLIKVRRFSVEDEIWLVNGKGLAARARISQIGSDQAHLDLLSFEQERGELGSRVTLAIANLKGDHLNLVVEKATELGVQEIIPLLTDRTIKKGLNRERLERIAIAAMKQSSRSRLPLIQALTPFKAFVETHGQGLQLFCHADDASRDLIKSVLRDKKVDASMWMDKVGGREERSSKQVG